MNLAGCLYYLVGRKFWNPFLSVLTVKSTKQKKANKKKNKKTPYHKVWLLLLIIKSV